MWPVKPSEADLYESYLTWYNRIVNDMLCDHAIATRNYPLVCKCVLQAVYGFRYSKKPDGSVDVWMPLPDGFPSWADGQYCRNLLRAQIRWAWGGYFDVNRSDDDYALIAMDRKAKLKAKAQEEAETKEKFMKSGKQCWNCKKWDHESGDNSMIRWCDRHEKNTDGLDSCSRWEALGKQLKVEKPFGSRSLV